MSTGVTAPEGDRSLATMSSWEVWIDRVFVWMPYATIAISVVLAQLGSPEASDRAWSVGLALVAATWTWLTFTRFGSPIRLDQRTLRIYFVGFVVIAGVAVIQQPMFLIYGVTGFFHGALLRPWALAFAGIGVSSAIVQSTIVYPNGTSTDWLIYIGVVIFQSAAVGAGLYAGDKVMEIAEERRETLQRLETAMAENVGLHEQLVAQAREAGILDERQRLAREIHDTIAQNLTGVITQLEAVQHSWSDEAEMRRHIENASHLAREGLTEARRSVQAMRPSPLDDSRLPEALSDVTEQWSEIAGIDAVVVTVGDRQPLRPEVEVTLLRVAQEALANVEKHAQASRVGVTLSFMDDSVTLDVRDNGVGFDRSAQTRSRELRTSLPWARESNTCKENSISNRRPVMGPPYQPAFPPTSSECHMPEDAGKSARPIRVLIVDDHPMVRDGIRSLLTSDPRFEVVGEASDGREAIERTEVAHPDVVLMDLRMPVLDGVSATREIVDRGLGTHVLILTTYDTESDVLPAIKAGATGYLLKDATRDELVRAVQAAASGESVLSPPVARRLLGQVRQTVKRHAQRPGVRGSCPGGTRKFEQGRGRGSIHQ